MPTRSYRLAPELLAYRRIGVSALREASQNLRKICDAPHRGPIGPIRRYAVKLDANAAPRYHSPPV